MLGNEIRSTDGNFVLQWYYLSVKSRSCMFQLSDCEILADKLLFITYWTPFSQIAKGNENLGSQSSHSETTYPQPTRKRTLVGLASVMGWLEPKNLFDSTNMLRLIECTL